MGVRIGLVLHHHQDIAGTLRRQAGHAAFTSVGDGELGAQCGVGGIAAVKVRGRSRRLWCENQAEVLMGSRHPTVHEFGNIPANPARRGGNNCRHYRSRIVVTAGHGPSSAYITLCPVTARPTTSGLCSFLPSVCDAVYPNGTAVKTAVELIEIQISAGHPGTLGNAAEIELEQTLGDRIGPSAIDPEFAVCSVVPAGFPHVDIDGPSFF